ncbi:hypothetical protein FI667_g2625, partial [Globisporangium splendens]
MSLLSDVTSAGVSVHDQQSDIKNGGLLAANLQAQRQLRGGADIGVKSNHVMQRRLAGATTDEEATSVSAGFCNESSSFLGVGNTKCLHENIGTAVFLLGIIVVISICFDRLIHYVRHGIHCPQLSKIVNRILQEVMIMGFISMVIFTLNTSGAMRNMSFTMDRLSESEQLHFYEFFHYIVFLTMIYFIAIVLLLLFIGTVVPKLIWNKHNSQDIEEESGRSEHAVGLQYSDEEENADYNRTLNGSEDRWTRGEFQSASRLHGNRPSTFRRTKSGMDLVQGSRAYSLLLERYQREGWCFRFNVLKQWHLWKSFEILAYNICQNRSRYIYKNPTEMERLFGVKPKPSNPNRWLLPQGHQVEPMTYARYHVLCMRNLLFHITDLHVSALFILVVISVLPSVCPNYDHWIFIGVGGILLLVNLVIFFKVLQILRGIVDDRLRVITMRDIRVRLTKLQNSDNSNLLPKEPEAPLQTPKRLSLKGVALGVRAVIRMQMSALCHRQLHHHDDRFWFDSPQFLLRLFQFATISQAFYLVWLSLVEAPTIMQTDRGAYLLPIMVLLPLLVLCVITPMTMPSLVLVMSLTGIFVDLNSETGKQGRRESYQIAQTRIRLMRRSFLKSHHNDDTVGSCPHVSSPTHDEHQDTVSSPSNVFLRIYDSPTAAAVHSKLGADLVSPVSSPMAPRSSPRSNEDTLAVSLLQARRSSSGGSSSLGRRNRDDNGYSGARRSFNLAAFQSSATPSSVLTSLYEGPRNNNYSESQQAALPNWSQAKVDRINSTQAAVPRTTDDVAPNSSNSTDPSPSPVSEPFKSYCSKYGGYPDS